MANTQAAALSPEVDASRIFGSLLRSYRQRANLSQRDAAQKLEISHSMLAKLELGSRLPPRDGAFYRRLRAIGLSEPEIADLLRTDEAPEWLVPDRPTRSVPGTDHQDATKSTTIAVGGFQVELLVQADPDVTEPELEALDQLVRTQITLTLHEFLRRKIALEEDVKTMLSQRKVKRGRGSRSKSSTVAQP